MNVYLSVTNMSFIKKSVEKANSIKSNMGRSLRGSYVTSGKTLLHGHLLLEVIEARKLPDMESWLAKLVDKKDVTDPFVEDLKHVYLDIKLLNNFFSLESSSRLHRFALKYA